MNQMLVVDVFILKKIQNKNRILQYGLINDNLLQLLQF